jgi:hypothetical protein
MLDVAILVATFIYWVVAIKFYGSLKADGRLTQTPCVIGAALWPIVAVVSIALSIYGSMRSMS